MALRHGKEVYTTSLPPELLEEFRCYCWDRGIKMNVVLEDLLKDFLKGKKVNKCRM